MSEAHSSSASGLPNSLNGMVFTLEDLSSVYGVKLWKLVFNLKTEKVNKFSQSVIAEFESLIPKLEQLGKSGQIDALILVSGKPGNFIAGADIAMIDSAKTMQEAEALSRAGQKLADQWEDLPFPTVVAINGIALGGGCELSLASTAIVISNDPAAKIGLPEVNLGVIPGMGGCVRLPRRVGLATALDMILAGKILSGERAFKVGLADGFLPKENFEESACRWVKAQMKSLKSGARIAKEPKLGGMGGPLGAALEKTSMGRMIMFRKARESVLSKTKGHYPAPLEAIDVMQGTSGSYGPKLRSQSRTRAMEREAQGFGKMAATQVSKNLIRLFFLTEEVKKAKGLPKGAVAIARPVKSAAGLGAGVMGGGIAQLLADKNIPVRMKDLNSAALATGMTAASRIFQKQLQKRKINQRQYLQKLNFIAPVTDFSGFHTVDVVIEAIVEKMDVKKKVFQELEGQVSDSCIIASNTSSLSITEMQTVLKNPSRFVGMHFFNPVNRMPLVEVIRGEKSSDEAVSTIFQFSKALGKTPIVVKDSPGFLVNRLLMPYLNEATWLLGDGVTIPELDKALLDFGMPMGPMDLIDEIGVDVGEKVSHILHDAFGARMEPAPFNAKIVASGRLGKKNGKGFYKYDAKGKNPELDTEIYQLLGVTPKAGAMPTEEMVERCILPMINEAARCLDEAVVSSATEVDLGMIMGTGFPPFRGGLLRYADSVGAVTLVERLKKYQKTLGARYEPAPRLMMMAEKGLSFYS